jgi:DNA-binding CsgD family transcriptional regulator
MKKSEIKTLVSFFSSAASNKVKALAEPLQRSFGIDTFWHTSIKQNGECTHFSNTPEGTQSYFESHYYENNPFLRHPDNYDTGYCIVSELSKDYFPEVLEAQVKHNLQHSLDHVLYLSRSGKDQVHLFGFATTQKNLPMLTTYLNSLGFLQTFIDYYLNEMKPMRRHLEQFTICLPELVGPSFFKKRDSIFRKKNAGPQFLRLLGNETVDVKFLKTLSSREMECLRLFLKGKTAKQTAALLGLSHRTVEFYFENVKNKLGCLTKAELFSYCSQYSI